MNILDSAKEKMRGLTDKAKGLLGKLGEQHADAQVDKPAQAPDAADDSDESSSGKSGPEQPSS